MAARACISASEYAASMAERCSTARTSISRAPAARAAAARSSWILASAKRSALVGSDGLGLVDLRLLQVLADLLAVDQQEVLLADVLLEEQRWRGGEIHVWAAIAGEGEGLGRVGGEVAGRHS